MPMSAYEVTPAYALYERLAKAGSLYEANCRQYLFLADEKRVNEVGLVPVVSSSYPIIFPKEICDALG